MDDDYLDDEDELIWQFRRQKRQQSHDQGLPSHKKIWYKKNIEGRRVRV